MDETRDGKVVLIAGNDEEAEIIRRYLADDVEWLEVRAEAAGKVAA